MRDFILKNVHAEDDRDELATLASLIQAIEMNPQEAARTLKLHLASVLRSLGITSGLKEALQLPAVAELWLPEERKVSKKSTVRALKRYAKNSSIKKVKHADLSHGNEAFPINDALLLGLMSDAD